MRIYELVLLVVIMVISIVSVIICKLEEQKIKDVHILDVNDVYEKETEIVIENSDKKTESENKKEIKPEKELVSLGEFKLTSYCPCNICCGKWANNRPNGKVYGAIGEELKENYSIAVDPDIIPYQTEVIINGHTYKAQDCGGAIKGNRIDVYMENHDVALEFGVQYAEVFLAK